MDVKLVKNEYDDTSDLTPSELEEVKGRFFCLHIWFIKNGLKDWALSIR